MEEAGLENGEEAEVVSNENDSYMGMYSPNEEHRIKPFLRDAIFTQQMQMMEDQKQKYISSILEIQKQSKK